MIPPLKVGPLYAYWGPLAFVLTVTFFKEGYEDLNRWRRDKEVNAQLYTKVTATGTATVRSSDLCVGDLVLVEKNQRVPADMILLRTTEVGRCKMN